MIGALRPARLLVLVLALPASTAFAERFGQLEKCVIQAPGGLVSAEARCGTLEVPEDPEAPGGRRIELAYGVIPSVAAGARPDPVFYLAGGPGQSAIDLLPLKRFALGEMNRSRDLIFVDQRGTGRSNPLTCDFDAVDPYLQPDPETIAELYRACLAELDADPRHYTTINSARDLDAVRAHLGFETINLVGTSYGTRLAQVYLRHFPEHVRSAVLDGVVPTRLPLGSEHGRALDDALARILDACSEDAACNRQFPDIRARLSGLRERFEAEVDPRRLELTQPRTGQSRTVEFDRDGLAQTLRMLSYSAQTQALLPLLIFEADTTGSADRLATQLMLVFDQLEDLIAVGLETSIGCTEDWPVWRELPERELAAERDTLLGDSMRTMRERICAIWPAGTAPEDFHAPFDSAVPILLLSGEFDPVTPPRYGDEAARQFSRSRHLTVTGQGHGVIMPPCVSGIAAEFVATLDLDGLDVSCLDRLGPAPFFLDLLGPAP